MKWFHEIITGVDNQTRDLGRISWIVSMASVIGHSCWAAYKGLVVDLSTFAQALSIVVVAHGAALWAKKDTEPKG